MGSRRTTKALKALVAVATIVFFLSTAVRSGWSHLNTDFPNYYTAAAALRHHEHLRNYYDWTWFVRQMNAAGIERIGAYTPQTPLTMLPMVPLTFFSPLAAKRIWMSVNLALLALTIWLLARITRFQVIDVWLFAFCGFFALRTNYLYGQYYVLLLCLLTLGFYFLQRNRFLAAGSTAAVAFGLKLYGGPFLLYFAAKRQWRAVAAMVVATAFLIIGAVALFGWNDVHYYASQILPRTLEGGSVDPYNPGVPSYSTLLRRVFMREPELNANPLYHAPWLFFFARTLVTVGIVAFTTAAVALNNLAEQRDFAWFTITSVLLSTSTASYTFILLLLPLILLLDGVEPRVGACVFVLYFLITFPMPLAWLFPKLWLLFALYFVTGWPLLRRIPPRIAGALALMAIVIAIVDAGRHMSDFLREPGQRFARVVIEKGALFSSFPAVTSAGIFYQAMDHDRYVLRWLHGDRNENFTFVGHVLHPRVAADGQSIEFGLASAAKLTMMRLDPATRRLNQTAMIIPVDVPTALISPDRKWLAYQSDQDGPTHIWVRNLTSGVAIRLTGGNCNSTAPAWESNSKFVVFASDCGRAFGLPALYRAEVPSESTP